MAAVKDLLDLLVELFCPGERLVKARAFIGVERSVRDVVADRVDMFLVELDP